MNFYSIYLVKTTFFVCRVSIFDCYMTMIFHRNTWIFTFFWHFFLDVFFMVLVIQCLLKYDFVTFLHYFSYFIACVCLSDYNGNRTHNHLVCKRTLNHLCKQAKWMSYVVSIYLYGAFKRILLSCHARVSKWIYTL